MTDDLILRQALSYARRGWPSSPASPARRSPPPGTATRTPPPTSSRSRTGSDATPAGTRPSPPAPPVPTSWTSTSTAPPGTGTPPSAGCHCAGLLEGAYGYVRTPSGGLHIYFTGTAQHCGHLAGHHVDFRSAGGYVLAPPSQVDGHPLPAVGDPRPRRHPELGARLPRAAHPAAAAAPRTPPGPAS